MRSLRIRKLRRSPPREIEDSNIGLRLPVIVPARAVSPALGRRFLDSSSSALNREEHLSGRHFRETAYPKKTERPSVLAEGLLFLATRNLYFAQPVERRQTQRGGELFSVLHDHRGSGCRLRGHAAFGRYRLGAQGTQPSGREPGTGNHEFRPTTIKANPNIWGGGHRWMT